MSANADAHDLERKLLAAKARALAAELAISSLEVVAQPFAALRQEKSYRLDGEPVDIKEFLADNEEGLDPEEVDNILALRPGESVSFGGGAAPIFTLSVDHV